MQTTLGVVSKQDPLPYPLINHQQKQMHATIKSQSTVPKCTYSGRWWGPRHTWLMKGFLRRGELPTLITLRGSFYIPRLLRAVTLQNLSHCRAIMATLNQEPIYFSPSFEKINACFLFLLCRDSLTLFLSWSIVQYMGSSLVGGLLISSQPDSNSCCGASSHTALKS